MHRITEQSPSWPGDAGRPGDVRVERLCQEEEAVERLPERRSGRGQEGMLTSTGFVFHEYSSYSGIHPCGAPVCQAWWLNGRGSYIQILINIRCSFIHERHRSHTCPNCDLLQVRILQLLCSKSPELSGAPGPL